MSASNSMSDHERDDIVSEFGCDPTLPPAPWRNMPSITQEKLEEVRMNMEGEFNEEEGETEEEAKIQDPGLLDPPYADCLDAAPVESRWDTQEWQNTIDMILKEYQMSLTVKESTSLMYYLSSVFALTREGVHGFVSGYRTRLDHNSTAIGQATADLSEMIARMFKVVNAMERVQRDTTVTFHSNQADQSKPLQKTTTPKIEKPVRDPSVATPLSIRPRTPPVPFKPTKSDTPSESKVEDELAVEKITIQSLSSVQAVKSALEKGKAVVDEGIKRHQENLEQRIKEGKLNERRIQDEIESQRSQDKEDTKGKKKLDVSEDESEDSIEVLIRLLAELNIPKEKYLAKYQKENASRVFEKMGVHVQSLTLRDLLIKYGSQQKAAKGLIDASEAARQMV
ncbi:TPA_asm: protein 2 [Treubia virus 1]|uniref:Protein 2 n=1 Tax=Treubia virus 1 TaxID=2977996 RepID=A0A9N7AB62_9RHAB|nr:TPA_asm: protein 2 [Treubia virus 1]